MAAPPRPAETGIAFAPGADGTRSTTQTGMRVLAAAMQAVDPDGADALRREPSWRQNYPHHFRRLVCGGLANPQAAVPCARAGLDAAWSALEWAGPDGPRDLHAALAQEPANPFTTHIVRGEGEARPAPWTVPLRGALLGGDALRAQIADWQNRGIIEAGAATALARCLAHPEWFDLSDRTFVLLGAASEAGPLPWLLRWRAHVVAVDLDRPATWQRLEALARSGNGRLLAPLRPGAERPGADLLQDAPALSAWLRSLDGPLDIAALAYLDGERHVRVVMAMDMLMHALCTAEPRTTLAFMATPTDVFAVRQATADAARSGYLGRPALSRAMQSILALASGQRFFQPPVDEREAAACPTPGYGVIDSLVLQQGPNYALAKRIQQWRALTARARGHRVSLNVAPSTTTASVLKNPALAAGFAGASSFGIEVFEPATTNALMAALWVHDLRCEESPANPAKSLDHPIAHFMDQACHGGMWRCPYLPRSALPFAAALGWMRQHLPGRR